MVRRKVVLIVLLLLTLLGLAAGLYDRARIAYEKSALTTSLNDVYLRYLDAKELIGNAYHLYGAMLFGEEKKADMVSFLLGVGQNETRFVASLQAGGGPAVSHLQFEPQTVRTVIVRSLRDAPSKQSEVLLKGLKEKEEEFIWKLFHDIRKERGKRKHDATVDIRISALMRRPSYIYKIAFLYIESELKLLELELPSHKDIDAMVDAYLALWRPGQYIRERVYLNFWLMEPFFGVEVVGLFEGEDMLKKRFGERLAIYGDISRVYWILQSVKNIRRGSPSLLEKFSALRLTRAASSLLSTAKSKLDQGEYGDEASLDAATLLSDAGRALHDQKVIEGAPSIGGARVKVLRLVAGERISGQEIHPSITRRLFNIFVYLFG